jgi:hypothetical protein
MHHKLWALNLLLAAVAAFAGWQLLNFWRAEKARESAVLSYHVAPFSMPPFTAAPVTPAMPLAGYADIARKDLFDPSRNSQSSLEVIPPPLVTLKQPIPPLPFYYGAMNLGDGPMAILSVDSSSPQHAIRPGEMIGSFKLIDVTRQDLTLEWDGQVVRKSLDALANLGTAPQSVAVAGGRTETPPRQSQEASAAGAKESSATTAYVPRTCMPNDSNRVGTEEAGVLKTQVQTPFGRVCLWNPVGK